MTDQKPNLVRNEWRRFLYRVRRYGNEHACKYIEGRIERRELPLFLSLKVTEFLLQGGKYMLAGRILNQLKRQSERHPLLDEQYTSWLWCSGRKAEARRLAQKNANKWKKSYLYSHAAGLYSLSNAPTTAERLFEKAETLARREAIR